MHRLDQDRAARIETETLEAMSGQTAALAQGMGRNDEDNLFPPPLWGREGRGVVGGCESVDDCA
jgi:hypothetical protein